MDLQRAELYEALEAGDENRAQSLVNRLQAGGVPPVDLCDVLVGPALLQVRRDSGAKSVSAAGVALAAGICERPGGFVGQPGPGAAAGRRGGR